MLTLARGQNSLSVLTVCFGLSAGNFIQLRSAPPKPSPTALPAQQMQKEGEGRAHFRSANTRACLSLPQKIDLLTKTSCYLSLQPSQIYSTTTTIVCNHLLLTFLETLIQLRSAHAAGLSFPQKVDLLKRQGERGRRAGAQLRGAHARPPETSPKLGSKHQLRKGGRTWKDPPVAR